MPWRECQGASKKINERLDSGFDRKDNVCLERRARSCETARSFQEIRITRMGTNICNTTGTELIRERELTDALFRISTIMNGPYDPDEAVSRMLEEASRAIGSRSAAIMLREGDGWAIRYAYPAEKELAGRMFRDNEAPEAAAAVNSKKAVIISGPMQQGGTPMAGMLGARSLLVLPLPGGAQKAAGAVYFDYFPAPDGCGAVEGVFAERIAGLLALAISAAASRRDYELLKEQLEEERARLDALLDEMPAGVVIVDASGKLIRGNEQAERIWRESLLKKAQDHAFGYRALHSDGRPYQADEWPLTRAYRNGELVSGKEIMIIRGDGSRGVISVSAGPIRDIRGRIIAGVMVFQDITERKEAEQARRRLAALVESSGQVAINLVGNETGTITTWSSGAERLYGYRAEEVVGRNLSLLVPPGFPSDIPALLDKLKKGEPIERHETVRVRKDGSLVPVSLNWTPIRNSEDVVVGASIVATDISDRRRVEEALRESEIKFRKIASAAQDAVILINNTGMVEFWNDAATKIFGFGSEEMMGKYLHSYIMPEKYAHDFKKGFEKFSLTGEGRFIGKTYEITARRKDGTEFPVELSLAALQLKDIWNAIGIVRDITARKRAEQTLTRTVKELERSNTELQQFAYVASHDLQEPLRTVSSFVELLGRKYKGRLDEKADQYISFAVDGAKRMSALINDLLSYSRVGTQGGGFEREDMNKVLAQALANLKVAIRESGAEVTGSALPVVHGDRTQLIQLLQNLISNAIKFTSEGVKPGIRVFAEPKAAEWLFGVQDNGIGIPREHHEKIFAIFQRLHGRDEYQGTGVGLAVCKRIVERHGGRIWVESAPEEGSIFYFTLPSADDGAAGRDAKEKNRDSPVPEA